MKSALRNFILILCLMFSSPALCQDRPEIDWSKYQRHMQYSINEDHQNGISYLISGSVALVGGLIGARITDDPLEVGVYTVFQSIGLASMGYGALLWQVGGEERVIYDTLNGASDLSEYHRMKVLRSYYRQKKEKTKRDALVRTITHGLVAALNFYSASEQKNDEMKNAFLFIGGVNTLAAISFSTQF